MSMCLCSIIVGDTTTIMSSKVKLFFFSFFYQPELGFFQSSSRWFVMGFEEPGIWQDAVTGKNAPSCQQESILMNTACLV